MAFANLLSFTISFFATTTQFVIGLWSYGVMTSDILGIFIHWKKNHKPNSPSAFDGDWQWEMEPTNFLVWRWVPSIGNLHKSAPHQSFRYARDVEHDVHWIHKDLDSIPFAVVSQHSCGIPLDHEVHTLRVSQMVIRVWDTLMSITWALSLVRIASICSLVFWRRDGCLGFIWTWHWILQIVFNIRFKTIE